MSGHASDHALERYSMGRCGEEELAQLEEHLLVCSRCQDRAAESDLLIHSLRGALAEGPLPSPRAERAGGGWFRRFFLSSRRLVWAPVLGTLLLVVVGWRDLREAGSAPQQVTLAAFRGVEDNIGVHAAPGAPIRLRLDLSTVRPSPHFRLEVVDASGSVTRQGNLPGAATASFDAGPLSSGHHWIRLYDANGTLLREYGLNVN
ncbi:MAG: hypothetical protein IT160_15510 [Bryobacterales bacterium]|nr:hypothetical protein [Bryobacterales bacterium]